MPPSVFTGAYDTFLRAVIAARKDAGVTQVELAARLGKPQPWVSKVERGVRRIDVIEFYAISRALKVDPVDFFAKIVRTLPKSVSI